MAVEKSVINLASQFVKDVKNCDISIYKAILFGSNAKGKANKLSDIDIAIVADEFDGFIFTDLDYFLSVKIKKKYAPIQVQTFNTKYFKKGDPFIDEIIRTGIEIKS